MKTTLRVRLLLVFIGITLSSIVKGQDYPATVIDVFGSRYGDSMWLFTVEGTTPAFDTGWDGIKMAGSTLAPRIYAIGSDYNYQVYSSSDIHQTPIGFEPGEDNVYSMRITNYNLAPTYSQLYLYDKKLGKVIDIAGLVTNYSFECSPVDSINRFEILTIIDTETDSVPGNADKKPNKGKGNNHGRSNPKSLIAFTLGTNLFVDNKSHKDGEAIVVNPSTGAQLIRFVVGASGITSKNVNLPSGNYMIILSNGIDINSQVIVF